MSNFQWLDCMSVGVVEFDTDHKHAIHMISRISAMLEQGRTRDAYNLATALLEDAQDHVEREERFLRAIGFPGVDTVIPAQKASLSNIERLADRILREPRRCQELAVEMINAFVAYLLRADINYKSYVDAAGLRDTPLPRA